MNGYEHTARAAKARKLADAMSAVGISEQNARRMTDKEWRMVAKAGGCHPPNSQATKDAVFASMAFHDAPVRMSVRQWREKVEATTCAATAS